VVNSPRSTRSFTDIGSRMKNIQDLNTLRQIPPHSLPYPRNAVRHENEPSFLIETTVPCLRRLPPLSTQGLKELIGFHDAAKAELDGFFAIAIQPDQPRTNLEPIKFTIIAVLVRTYEGTIAAEHHNVARGWRYRPGAPVMERKMDIASTTARKSPHGFFLLLSPRAYLTRDPVDLRRAHGYARAQEPAACSIERSISRLFGYSLPSG
jgi:hypothetical protein